MAGKMAGEYRLGRLLGEGGFGAVFEAEHPLLKRRAAVKVLHRVADRDSDAVQRFVSEAQAVNQIRSRHIVDIFSFGQLSDGRHFYVMDLLDGEPLDRHLKHGERLSVATALQLLQPIAEALDLAHGAGIIHRDLKPQNIFLSWEKNEEVVPKLLDFGMAKLLGSSPVHTVSGTPIGTPLYMSPEQARGDKVDLRTDVYALGVLCYELLTGRLPFEAESTVAVLMAHIIQNAEPPSEVCPDLPAVFDAPVLRMLAKDPEARPASATEALSELRAAAREVGIEVPAELPKLARPEPRVSLPIDHGVTDPSSVEGATTELAPSVPATVRSAPPARPLWVWALWAALVVIGAALAVVFGRERQAPASPRPASSAAVTASVLVPLVPSSASAPSASGEAAPASATASEKPPAPSEIKPKKRPEIKAAPAASAIPHDLESPF